MLSAPQGRRIARASASNGNAFCAAKATECARVSARGIDAVCAAKATECARVSAKSGNAIMRSAPRGDRVRARECEGH
jgi:hypothetical protein